MTTELCPINIPSSMASQQLSQLSLDSKGLQELRRLLMYEQNIPFPPFNHWWLNLSMLLIEKVDL